MTGKETLNIRIQGELPWNCFPAQGGHWIGVCEPVKLTIQADTWAELMEDIGHALDAMLKDLLKSNDLDKFMRDHGWTMVGLMPRQDSKNIRFDVPFIPSMIGSPDGSSPIIHQ